MPKLKKGFTLIELLIVVALMGALAMMGIITYQGAQAKARDAERKSDLRNIQTSLRVYYNDQGKYPDNSGTFQINGCGGASCNTACTWGTAWSCGAGGNQKYMNILPKDPRGLIEYRYTYVDDDNYTIEACLENKADPQGTGASSWCPAASGTVYKVQP